MYLFYNPKDPIDKNHNKETLKIAKAIRQKRENELNKPEVYSLYEREQLKIIELGKRNYVDYFEELAPSCPLAYTYLALSSSAIRSFLSILSKALISSS